MDQANQSQSSSYLNGSIAVLAIIWLITLIFFQLSALYILAVLLLLLGPLGYYYHKKLQIPLELLSFHFVIPHILVASTVFILNWLLDFVAKDYGTPFELGGDFTNRIPWYGYILIPIFSFLSAVIIEGSKFYFVQWSILAHQLFHPLTIMIVSTTAGIALGSGVILFSVFIQGFQTVSRIIVFSLLFFTFVPLQTATSFIMGIGLADKYIFGGTAKWYTILSVPVMVSFLSALQKIVLHTMFRGFLDMKKVIIATCLLDLLLLVCTSIESGCQYKQYRTKRQNFESSGAPYNNIH